MSGGRDRDGRPAATNVRRASQKWKCYPKWPRWRFRPANPSRFSVRCSGFASNGLWGWYPSCRRSALEKIAWSSTPGICSIGYVLATFPPTPSRPAACRPHPRCPHHHHRCHRGAGGKPGNDPARYRNRAPPRGHASVGHHHRGAGGKPKREPARYRNRAPRRRQPNVLGGQQHYSGVPDCARYGVLARRAR